MNFFSSAGGSEARATQTVEKRNNTARKAGNNFLMSGSFAAVEVDRQEAAHPPPSLKIYAYHYVWPLQWSIRTNMSKEVWKNLETLGTRRDEYVL